MNDGWKFLASMLDVAQMVNDKRMEVELQPTPYSYEWLPLLTASHYDSRYHYRARVKEVKWQKERDAAKRGETIQYRNNDREEWCDLNNPSFDEKCVNNGFYRIKPKPITAESREYALIQNGKIVAVQWMITPYAVSWVRTLNKEVRKVEVELE